MDTVYVDAFDHGRLGGVFCGNDQVGNALLARADSDGQRAADGAYGAIEGELADEDVPIQGLHRAHGAQDADGNGEIEAGAFLAYVGRGQVDGDAFVGVAETGIDQRTLNALAAFPDGDVGHANHYGVPRVARREHVDFDIDQVSIDAINRSAEGFEERHENDSGAAWRKSSTIFVGLAAERPPDLEEGGKLGYGRQNLVRHRFCGVCRQDRGAHPRWPSQ